jgi:ribosomal protein S28E/S33
MASKKSGGVNDTTQIRVPQLQKSTKKVATRNFFAPLRASDMDTDSTNTEAKPREAATPAKPGRPPSIVLTSAVKIILLQKQLKLVVSENFEFRSTRKGTRVITRNMRISSPSNPTSTAKTRYTLPSTPIPKSF